MRVCSVLILSTDLSRHFRTDAFCECSRSSTQDRATCLLIDFDNSVDLDATNEDKGTELTQKTVRPHIEEQG